MLNVDVLITDEIKETVDHTGDVAVDYAKAGFTHALKADSGQVDAVFNVTGLEIFHKLLSCHNGAVDFAFLGRAAKMGVRITFL